MGVRMAIVDRLLSHQEGRTRLARVGRDPVANRRWANRDLSSLVEGMFGELVSHDLDDADRARIATSLPRGWMPTPIDPGGTLGTRWWILDDGREVGTLGTHALPQARLRIFSVYVDPDARGRGIATRVLDLAERAAVEAGCGGLTLGTEWTWFRPAVLYLRLGFWARHWRHDLALVRGPDLPRHRIEIGAEEARLSIPAGPVLRARRNGEWLDWEWVAELVDHDLAEATFSLALALAGWPLRRSPEEWERSRWQPDVGAPESLARRIEVFEAVARRDGTKIRAPRIPGLTYRDLEDM